MDNDLIQDTNLDLLQVNAVEVEYSGIAPINVDNQEHTISLDPSALSSKLDTSAFDEWTATHSAGEEYSAGEGIDITDHVISYTGDPGDATPWISGNKIITSADYMQPGEFIQVVSSFDLSGNKNHFITMKGQGYYFPTNQQLKERVGIDDYLPQSSFSSYTASIASNLESNWNYTNSAYSQSINNFYNKLDISSFSAYSADADTTEYSAGDGIDITDHVISVTAQLTGDYLTKESADTLYQPIGDYLTTSDSGNFYPMEGNPSGFLTGVDLSNYYKKNETSSKEEIENAITSVENVINNLSGEYYPLTSNPSGYLTAHQSLDDYQKTADMTAYQEKGDYYSASNPSGFITGVDLSNYYEKNETCSKEEINTTINNLSGEYYPLDNPSGFITGVDLSDYQLTADMTGYQEKGDYYSASNPSGFITGVDLTNYYEKNETSSKEEISAAFEALSGIDDPYELSAGDGISIVNDNTAKKTVITCTATGSPIDTGAFYPMTGNPSGFLTAHQSLDNYYTKSDIQNQSGNYYPMTGNPSGFLTAHQSLSNYYRKNETSSKEEISAALTSKQDNLTIAGSNSVISYINGSALSAGESYIFDRNVYNDNGHLYVQNVENNVLATTGTMDDIVYNISIHNANITSSSLVHIKLEDAVTGIVFRVCDNTYSPIAYPAYQTTYTAVGTAHDANANSYTGFLVSSTNAVKDWYIDLNKVNMANGFYYLQLWPLYSPWTGNYEMSAYTASFGWNTDTLATQPWVLEQLKDVDVDYYGVAPIVVNNDENKISANIWSLSAGSGLRITEDAIQNVATIEITGQQGGGSNVHWYIDTPNEHTSADINLTIQTTATLGGIYDRYLMNGTAFIGELIPSADTQADAGKFLTVTAGSPRWGELPSGSYGIMTQVVSNSGLATANGILYIVTGS